MTLEELVSQDDEQAQAFMQIELMIKAFIEKEKRKPTKAHLSDYDELQSWLAWAAMLQGLKWVRTHKNKNYLE